MRLQKLSNYVRGSIMIYEVLIIAANVRCWVVLLDFIFIISSTLLSAYSIPWPYWLRTSQQSKLHKYTYITWVSFYQSWVILGGNGGNKWSELWFHLWVRTTVWQRRSKELYGDDLGSDLRRVGGSVLDIHSLWTTMDGKQVPVTILSA